MRCAPLLAMLVLGCGGSAGSLDVGAPELDAGATDAPGPGPEPDAGSDASAPDAAPPDGGPVGTCTFTPDTITCSRYADPDPRVADDESQTTLTVTLAAAALDGSARTIDATIDVLYMPYVPTGSDGSMPMGFARGASNDPLVIDAAITIRHHDIPTRTTRYERRPLTGTVTLDATGHGHIVAWGFDHDVAPD